MFHVPFHKVPADQPQAGQIYFDPRLALVVDNNLACLLCQAHYGDAGPCDEGKPVQSPHRQSANSEYRNDRRAYP